MTDHSPFLHHTNIIRVMSWQRNGAGRPRSDQSSVGVCVKLVNQTTDRLRTRFSVPDGRLLV
jgi:hypothetical protein